MLNDRVVPVGDVDRTVGTDLHVDRAKCDVVGLDDFLLFLGDKAGAEFRQHEPTDAVTTEIVGDQASLPVFGQVSAGDDFEAAVFGAAGVQAGQNPPGTVGGCVVGTGDHVVDALAARTVGGKGGAVVVEGRPPRIDQSAGEDAELQVAGLELPDAAGVQPPDSPRRFDVAVNVNRLAEVESLFGAPAECVHDVVRIFGAESGEHDTSTIRLAVAVSVGEVQQLGAGTHVDAAVTGRDGGRDEQTIGEDGGLGR